MKNNYGNYVVQKALKISKNLAKKKLIFAILNDLGKIKDVKLTAKWRNIILMNLPSASTNEIEKEEMERILIMINNVNFNVNNVWVVNNNYNNNYLERNANL